MVIRNKSLYPLSHHHQHVLVVSLRLRRAGTENSEMTNEEILEKFRTFWETGGKEHFREEEEILFPVYSQYASLDASEISELLLERIRIRGLVMQLLESKSISVERMQELGNLLEAQVRKEERVIFPMIEKALPEEILHRLEPYFHLNYKEQ